MSEPVIVTMQGGTLSCDPNPVTFYWEESDQLSWNLETSGYGFVSITGTPFEQVAVSDATVVGSQDNQDEGDYTYTITVQPTGGGTKTSADFTIKNRPKVGER